MAHAIQSSDLFGKIVVETRVESFAGGWIYSDRIHRPPGISLDHWDGPFENPLNGLAATPLLGVIVGVFRMSLSIIHSIAHLFAALFTFKKGHLYHAAKGGCEFFKGFIEAIPFLGRKFADYYCTHGEWWIIKIYHPEKPDTLDLFMGKWEGFKRDRPSGYITVSP